MCACECVCLCILNIEALEVECECYSLDESDNIKPPNVAIRHQLRISFILIKSHVRTKAK